MILCLICKKNETDEEVWFQNEVRPICMECQKKYFSEVKDD